MNKMMLKAMIAGTAMAAAAFGANAANAATASGTATAKILRPLTIVATPGTSLNFGTIVTGTSAAAVVVSSAGALTSCGTGLICTGTTGAAGFTLGGTTGVAVPVSVPATVTLNGSVSGTMTASLAISAATVTLVGSAGSYTVGGTLNVGASQADGNYTGTFTATAVYP